MNIEGTTLLKQFITYSYNPLIVLIIVIIGAIIAFIGILMLQCNYSIGVLPLFCGLIFILTFESIALEKEHKTFLNYPAYTHYIIQINDKTAWTEIAPNYTIVEEVYPATGIYEIKREYKEGDEQ